MNTLARRWFLRECGLGVGAAALQTLLARDGLSAPAASDANNTGVTRPLAPKPPHYLPKAQRVVYLFHAGAPSHLELYDPKPELTKRNGQLPPPSLLKDYRAAFIKPNSALLGPKFPFAKHGKCGMELSSLLPRLASIADDICLIRSMQTDAVNHAPAQILMNTGTQQFGRPSFGAWTLYGLGSESANLPGYVVLTSAKGTSGGASNYGCGFLPTAYAGVPFRASGDPVLYLSNPPGIDDVAQQQSIATLAQLNTLTRQTQGDPQVLARIQSYELAYKLQTSAPELMDLSKEPRAVLDLYGIKNPQESTYARNCLLARRLLERGTRFVQLFHEAWDQHGDLTNQMKRNAGDTDQATTALVIDLKQRGLLDDTLVIWGGEFGRTPMVQGGNDGRDHHNRCYSVWIAGGGVKRGYVHGSSDELGFNVATDPVHVHDLNATLLHLLGLDHERLTFRFQGRDYRLTDVHGQLVRSILA